MKVLEKGSGQKGCSVKRRCSGDGNGGGGCGALLLIEHPDLYLTSHTDMKGKTETYATFSCSECGVETDIECPPNIRATLLTRKGRMNELARPS